MALHQSPTLNLPDSVNKCQNWYRNVFVDATVHLNFVIYRFELLRRTVITRDWSGDPRLQRVCRPFSVSHRTNLPSLKTHRYEAGYVWLLTFKSISILILCFEVVTWYSSSNWCENDTLLIKTLYIFVKRSKRCPSFTASSVGFFWKLQ